jgi:CRISPR system Cascade subunit CasE
MYLSRLLLDPRSRQVQSELSNRYELHRTLTAQFPEENREDIGLLYRVERADPYVLQPITLLVQTVLEPDWQELDELMAEPPGVKSFDPWHSDGARYYFRLLGNPTARRKQPDGKSKRVGLYTRQEQTDWLTRKADRGGFRILDLRITDLGIVESLKKRSGRDFQIKHLAVQFDGVLQVADPSRFEDTLINGIGSAKAFGFGLLSLAG